MYIGSQTALHIIKSYYSQPEHLRPLLSPAVHSCISNRQTNMEASRGQNGIQLLLAAEQEAQHIVNAARSAKQARLKQAKDEAERDIAQFRAQMEADYQRKVAETSGDSGANVKRLEQETEEKINQLKSEASRISEEVIHMLIRQVTYVKV